MLAYHAGLAAVAGGDLAAAVKRLRAAVALDKRYVGLLQADPLAAALRELPRQLEAVGDSGWRQRLERLRGPAPSFAADDDRMVWAAASPRVIGIGIRAARPAAPDRRQPARRGRRCETCEHVLDRHEGPQTARGHVFSIHEAARLLVEVGKGTSYRWSSRTTRRDANRLSRILFGRLTPSQHGQLAQDYLATFARSSSTPSARRTRCQTPSCSTRSRSPSR
jgi:hypothetical protein